MTKKFYLKYNKETIKLDSKPFAGGGEGDLYKIAAPKKYKGYVAKIYHEHKRTALREAKIQYLIQHPPAGLTEKSAIVWIKDSLYDDAFQFMGFIMPFVRGKKLEVLCLGKLPRKLNREWSRFDLRVPEALNYRLRICFNLAVAIYQVHATNNYVLVDMKPDNIIIQPNGLVAIVDTDSVEVIENGKAIYPAPVATPEYTPPEFYRNEYRKSDTVGESWDRFGLAVIFYKLLFGIHPYAASCHPPYDGLVSLDDKIKHGLFVHSGNKAKHFRITPPPHAKFTALDIRLQQLFIDCFEAGHATPNIRPTANEWCAALLSAIGDPKLEAHFAHILGLWGQSHQFTMPSRLYRQHQLELNPKLWLEQKVRNAFNTPPILPVKLHNQIKKGGGKVELVLDNVDYIWGWGIAIAVIIAAILWIPNFGNWILGHLFLSSWLKVNFFSIAICVGINYAFPRVVSLFRHGFSKDVQLRRLWNKFRVYYPKLQEDIQLLKKDLQDQIMQTSQSAIQQFRAQQKTHLEPLKNYLLEKDKAVNELINRQSEELQLVGKQYVAQLRNQDFIKGYTIKSTTALWREGMKIYQKKLDKITDELTQNVEQLKGYAAIKRAHQAQQNVLKKEDEKVQEILMEEALILFDIKHFIKKHLTEREDRYLKYLLEEKGVKSLYTIGTTFVSEEYIQFLANNSLKGASTLVSISKKRYPDAYDKFLKLHKHYQPKIDRAKERYIEYDQQYFQEIYAIKRQEYQQALANLNTDFINKKQALIDENVKINKRELDKEMTALTTELESLKEAEKEAIKVVEAKYKDAYDLIIAECETMIQATSSQLEGMNNQYKIAVDELLERKEISKIRIQLDEKVEKVKSDIDKLQEMKF